MRIAVLIPDPDYPEPWRWAYDVEAAALIAAGAEVVPVAWTEAGRPVGFRPDPALGGLGLSP